MGKSSRLRTQKRRAVTNVAQDNPYAHLDRSTWDGYGNNLNAAFRAAADTSWGEHWQHLTATMEMKGGQVVITAGVKLFSREDNSPTSFQELGLGPAELEAVGAVVNLWAVELKDKGLHMWGFLSFQVSRESEQCALAPVFATELRLQGKSYTRWVTSLGKGLDRLEAITGELATEAVAPTITEIYAEKIHRLAAIMLEKNNYVQPWVYAGILVDARNIHAEPVIRIARKFRDEEPFEYIELDERLRDEMIEAATQWRIAAAHAGEESWMVLNLAIKTGLRARHFLQVRECVGDRSLPLLDKGEERLLAHYDGLYARGLDELLIH